MTERSLRRALVPLGAYLLAFGLLSLGGARRTAPVVLVAAALLVVAAVLTQRLLREARRTGRPGPRTRLLVPLAIMAAGAGLVAYWALGGSTGGWGLAGVCALYLGAGQALAEVRARRDAPRWRGPAVSAACAALFAAGLLLCLGVSAPWLLVAAAALLLAPVGLTLTSEDVLRRPPRALRLGLAAGPLAALAGGLLLPVAGVPAAFTWPAVAALFVLVGAIASNTQADVLLIVTVIGLIWAATPRPAEPAGTIEPERGASALAALGDSYMSGEGARRFFEGTNDAGVNECRRSPTAYAHLVVLAGAAEHLAFYACSGAVASHLHRRGKWEPTQLAQLRSLLDRSGADLDLVLVSIGGNDAGFATIGMACLAPGSCVERGQAWLTRLEEVGRRLRSAYAEIRRVVRDDVPVVAVPYPDPIRETPCGYSLLGEDEHRFLHRFVEQLNGVVEQAARDARFHYLGEMARAFTGRQRICDAPQGALGVNFIALESINGAVDQVVLPSNWIHNSLHPNEDGHRTMARVLQQWMRAHPDPPAAAPAADPGPRFTPATLEELAGAVPHCGGPGAMPDYCDRDDEGWTVTQVALVIARAALPALLVVAGWWLLWLPVLQRTRPWWASLGEQDVRARAPARSASPGER